MYCLLIDGQPYQEKCRTITFQYCEDAHKYFRDNFDISPHRCQIKDLTPNPILTGTILSQKGLPNG